MSRRVHAIAILLAGGACSALFALPGCGRDDAPGAQTSGGSGAPKARRDAGSKVPGGHAGAKPAAMTASLVPDLPALDAPARPDAGVDAGGGLDEDHGRHLKHVPRDALFAARLRVGGLADRLSNSALGQALARLGPRLGPRPEAKDQDGATGTTGPLEWVGRQVGMLRASLERETPALEKPFDLLAAANGEWVVALLDVDLDAAGSGAACPLTAVSYLDTAAAPDRLRAMIDDLVADSRAPPSVRELGAAHYELTDAIGRVEVRLADGCFSVLVAPPDTSRPTLASLDALEPAASLVSADVVRRSPRASRSGTVLAEFHVNAEPLWPRIREALGADQAQVLDVLGVFGIRGLAGHVVLEGDVFHDDFTVVSPGRRDLVTSLFDGAATDPRLGDYAPADADDALVASLDLARALDSVRERLPSTARRELDRNMRMMDAESGFALRDEVLATIGPTLMFASRGSFAAAAAGAEVEAVLALQVRDMSAAKRMLDRLLRAGMLPAKPRTIGRTRAYSLALPLADLPPWLEISFALHEGAFVVATSADTLEKALLAATGAAAGHAGLRAALERRASDAFSVSVSSTAAELCGLHDLVTMGLEQARLAGAPEPPFALPTRAQVEAFAAGLQDGVRSWRAAPHGLVLESVSPLGSQSLSVVPLAVVASIAIPQLLESRINANERAAAATLRCIVSAQAQFQAMAAADRDHDGLGEYGSFGELSGAVVLPSGLRLNPPVLPPAFGTLEDGCVTRSGYVFRVYLPGAAAQPLGEVGTGGIAGAVDPDAAEQDFVAYAWPREPGATGVSVFMVDAQGDLYCAASEDFEPRLQGTTSIPAADSAFGRIDSIRSESVRGRVFVGARGQRWYLVR